MKLLLKCLQKGVEIARPFECESVAVAEAQLDAIKVQLDRDFRNLKRFSGTKSPLGLGISSVDGMSEATRRGMRWGNRPVLLFGLVLPAGEVLFTKYTIEVV